MSTPESQSGLTAEELEDYAELRKLISSSASLAVLDDFAKWLFGLTGVAGTVASGLGLTHASDLSRDGRQLLAISVLLIACALVLAAFARFPIPLGHVNRYKPASMKQALGRVLWVRFWLLLPATLLFAAGLALAGWAQVAR